MLTKRSSPPLAGSKKSADRRWASRCSLWVVIEALSIRTVDRGLRRIAPGAISPENSVNRPRTLLIRWRTLKPTSECAGSMVQVPATRPVDAVMRS